MVKTVVYDTTKVTHKNVVINFAYIYAAQKGMWTFKYYTICPFALRVCECMRAGAVGRSGRCAVIDWRLAGGRRRRRRRRRVGRWAAGRSEPSGSAGGAAPVSHHAPAGQESPPAGPVTGGRSSVSERADDGRRQAAAVGAAPGPAGPTAHRRQRQRQLRQCRQHTAARRHQAVHTGLSGATRDENG